VSGEQPSIRVTMTREEAYDFLQQLATDDDLRARVEADPGRELARRGIHISPELLPAQAKLASKDHIADMLYVMGDDPENKLGRPKGEAWLYHTMCFVFMFGALPFARRPQPDGAP
jgi:hypothetical protein